MARKKISGSGLVLIGILIVIGVVVKYWQLFISLGTVILIAWYIVKKVKNSATPRNQTFTKSTPSNASLNSIRPENTGGSTIQSLSSSGSLISQSNTDYGTGVQQQSVSVDSVWVPQGRTIEKDGYSILGGLIYVGKGLKSVSGWDTEPALIDLSLKIDKSNPDRAGSKMDYWPSFSKIDPNMGSAVNSGHQIIHAAAKFL